MGTLKTRDWKRRDCNTQDLKSMESVTVFKSKSYGAEIKTVYGGIDTPTDSDGDDSDDDTDASTNAVVATVTTPASH